MSFVANFFLCVLVLCGIWAAVSAALLSAFVLVERAANETKDQSSKTSERIRLAKRASLIALACIAPMVFLGRSAKMDIVGWMLVLLTLFCLYSLLVLYRDKYRAKATEVAGVFKRPGSDLPD